jgi:PKD repeat protein
MAGKNTFPAFKDANNGYCLKFYSTTDTLNLLAKSTDGGVTYTAATYGGSLYNNQLTFVPGTTSTWVSSGVDATNQATRIGLSYSFDDGANFNAVDPDLQGTQVTAETSFNDSVMYAGSFSTGTTDGIFVCHVPVVAAAANFTSNTQAVAKGGQVIFTNTSTGIATAPCTYQWTCQGGTPGTSSSKNPSAITYNTPGTYNVTLKVWNAFGSINTLVKTGYIYVGGVGVDELSQSAIKVYPNPVKDVMNVETGSNIQSIQLFNVTGQMVVNKQVDGKTVTLSTSSLKAGIYMLKVVTENGTIERKVVVQ